MTLIGFSSCKKDGDLTQSEQLVQDIEKIENYLKDHQLTAQKTNTGLHYIISEEGTGSNPTVNSTINVQYEGKFLDDSQFEEGNITAPLRNMIQGWIEGVQLFKTGGRGRLFIPSYLAYGTTGSGKVPPNTVIIFDEFNVLTLD